MRCFGRVLELQLVSSQTELLNGRRWSLNKTVPKFGLMDGSGPLAEGCVDAVDATGFFPGRHMLFQLVASKTGTAAINTVTAGDQLKQPTF